MPVRPSVSLSECISEAPTGLIYVKSDIVDFMKICRYIPHLVKIQQKYRAHYMKTYVRFIVSGDMKLPSQRSLSVKQYQAVSLSVRPHV